MVARALVLFKGKPLIRQNVWRVRRGNFRVGGRNNYLCKVDAKRDIRIPVVPVVQKSAPPPSLSCKIHHCGRAAAAAAA